MNRLNDIIEMILITLSDLLYFNLIIIIIIGKRNSKLGEPG